MKKQSLYTRILLPVIFVLLLLPPITYFVFNYAAEQYTIKKTSDDLTAMEKNIIPLITENFQNQDDVSIQEQVKNFLGQAGPLSHRIGGDAQLLILNRDMQLIYPRDEQQRILKEPLAAEFIQAFEKDDMSLNDDFVEFTSSSGDEYLMNIYEFPAHSGPLKYIIIYCSTSQITDWVKDAGIIAFFISLTLVLATILILWAVIRRVSRPLRRICIEAERIGKSDFSLIETSFSIRELEELRLAMNRMAEQLCHSDKVQKDFFQNVSHELRNPLMSISGYAQGIEQGLFDPPYDAARTILEESGRLTELVNSLLTLSRMESGQNATAFTSVSVMDCIKDCLDRVYGLSFQKNISLNVVPFNEKQNIYGDEELLEQILDNLLTNAIRYAKETVTIEVIPKEDKIYISVSDDGEGIDEKDLPHLFERCYKGKNGHFGLGLSIAHTAVLAMNGKLIAENNPTGGAVFTVILPAYNH